MVQSQYRPPRSFSSEGFSGTAGEAGAAACLGRDSGDSSAEITHLPCTTYQQVNVGAPVHGIAQLEPGDLLFIPGSDGTPQVPGHVGMYLGN